VQFGNVTASASITSASQRAVDELLAADKLCLRASQRTRTLLALSALPLCNMAAQMLFIWVMPRRQDSSLDKRINK